MLHLAILKLVTYFAALPACNPNQGKQFSFFGFPHWWQYITTGEKDIFGKCTPKIKFPEGIWAIAFALASMLLYLAGLVAVFMIIYSGILYMTAAGNAEKAAAARKRVLNAIIGLAIVLIATPVVAFLGNRLGG
jgi:hypothetical protein